MASKIRLIADRYAVQIASGRKGGMSTVYRAVDGESGDQVAVKVFRVPDGVDDDDIVKETFRREVAALEQLKHPNIVVLRDHGIGGQGADTFLVLDWMDSTLREYMKANPPDGWDTFYENIMRPLLLALNFAHERHCVHRDVKPANILVSAEGIVKLADFGIAKLKEWMTPGITLADFQTRPYTPPEIDDGFRTDTRDVFSLALTMLECFTGERARSHDQIPALLDQFDSTPETIDVFQSALSLQPEERPRNAGAFLAELDRIYRKRAMSWRESIGIRIPPSHEDRIVQGLGEATLEKTKSFIVSELESGAMLLPWERRDAQGRLAVSENEYRLLGDSLYLHIKIDDRSKNHLVVFAAAIPQADLMEIWRKRAWPLPYAVTYGTPTSDTNGKKLMEQLLVGIHDHNEELRTSDLDREKEKLFTTWGSILRAKREAEKEKVSPIDYRRFKSDGRLVTFDAVKPIEVPDELIGQTRYVEFRAGGRFFGEVQHASRSQVTVAFEHIEDCPDSGQLQFDVRGAERALDRQKRALDAVRFGRSTRSDLGKLLLLPGSADEAGRCEDVEFVQGDLDEAKRAAVEAAVAAKDFLVVQGPPGTGKTTLIAEIVFQQHKRYPGSQVLVASQTHAALDNAIERIEKHDHSLRIVRIGDPFDGRVADSVKDLVIDRQMEVWVDEVRSRGEEHLFEWAKRNGMNPNDVRIGLQLQKLTAETLRNQQLSAKLEDARLAVEQGAPDQDLEIDVATDLGELGETPAERLSRLQDEQARAHRRIEVASIRLRQFGEIGEELSLLSLEEQRSWITSLLEGKSHVQQFRDLLEMHEEWWARLYKTEDFYDAFLGGCDVVAATCLGLAGRFGAGNIEYDLCIVDEASKAWATEMLVPMVAGNKWVIIGDSKQLPPFEGTLSERRDLLAKYDLDDSALEQTLFDRLAFNLPGKSVKTLTIQHRMTAAIGDLISDCFYTGELTSARKDTPDLLSPILSRNVVWISTSGMDSTSEERDEATYINPCEASVIVDLLEKIDAEAGKQGRGLEVAVIAGYAGQCRHITRVAGARDANWPNLHVDINTVDAFQGREADVCIYSVTRANREGRIGFLRREARLNVALSRGKDWLIVVGDHEFCRSASDPNPLRLVVEYIETHPDTACLKEVGS